MRAAAERGNLETILRVIGEADPPLRAEVARRVCAALGWHLAAARVGEDFAARYGERPVLLETLVETPRFRGTCYRAAIWRYLGETAGRVLFLTLLGRECPAMPCDVVFDTAEWHAVTIVTARKPPPDTPPTLDQMVRMVAGLGGFLGRKSNGFPRPSNPLDRTPACRRFRAGDGGPARRRGGGYG